MQTNQTILSLQGCNLPNDPVTTQKKHRGRPLKLIFELELKEIFKLFLSTNQTEREQATLKTARKRLRMPSTSLKLILANKALFLAQDALFIVDKT